MSLRSPESAQGETELNTMEQLKILVNKVFLRIEKCSIKI